MYLVELHPSWFSTTRKQGNIDICHEKGVGLFVADIINCHGFSLGYSEDAPSVTILSVLSAPMSIFVKS